MTATYNLRVQNNATFRWTRDFSQIAAAYNVAAGVIRMQARTSPFAPDPPALEFNSDGSNGAAGLITYDPTTKLAVFAAPETAVAAMRTQLAYDCRLELPGGASVLLFFGRILWLAGVTRAPTDPAGQTGVAGIGDTVSVDGETATSPTPLPQSLAAAVAAAQAAQVAGAASATAAATSAASVTAAGLAAALAALSSSQRLALLQALASSLPVYSGSGPAPVPAGQLFIDNGYVVIAQ